MIEEEDGNDSPTVQYPSSTELQGRGIELVQSAGKITYCLNALPSSGRL